ncbi:MAG TPA: hypothetical protein VN253_17490 [Kofleriaceae bacterium]|nr:hypothetical protein [Kofleriaceae bacterium]
MKIQFTDFEAPRRKAIAAMRGSLDAAMWDRNAGFIAELRTAISQHRVASHPAIAALNSSTLSLAAMRRIHLEYRHAIVQIFTDALLMAQHLSHRLEPRLPPGAKMPARFLLTLNDLDEFGFRPGTDSRGAYAGNPEYAHYPLFEAVCDDLGMSVAQRREHVPGPIAQQVRAYLEAAYADYDALVALLAVAEEEVILFSPPLRQATKALGIDVTTGYYHVHGLSTDNTAEAADDAHEDDLWVILNQALEPQRYAAIRAMCLRYCDLWDEFWTEQLRSST